MRGSRKLISLINLILSTKQMCLHLSLQEMLNLMIDLLSKCRVRWKVTDEQVLRETVRELYSTIAHILR